MASTNARTGSAALGAAAFCLMSLLALGACPARTVGAERPEFAPEWVYDTTVHPDDSLVNVKVRSNRWVDCDTLQTIVRDIFRIEGVDGTEAESEAKALALWKWFRILVCNSRPHAREGPYGKTRRQREPHKSMTVYGHHECGGLSAPMAALWRAAGYIGYKESSHGHSTVVLRYPDADGVWRMHAFDPMGGFYWWDAKNRRIGVRSLPVMRGTVFRRLEPISDHTLRTSLRWGERLVRQWDAEGCILRNESTTAAYFQKRIFDSTAGIEVQTLEADTTPAHFRKPLWPDSTNTACSPEAKGKAVLHPNQAGTPTAFIYRLPSPYVGVEGICEATLLKTDETDTCRLHFSTDLGKTWHVFFDKQKTGREDVAIDIGNKPYFERKPAITSNYTILVKAEFRTEGDPRQVGMDRLKVTVKRQLNRQMLMNLLPGENVIEVSADRAAPGTALQLDINYIVNGEPKTATRIINAFPFYFAINIEGVSSDHLKRMRRKATLFNLETWPLRMGAIGMRLVAAKSVTPDESLPAADGRAIFKRKSPHPFTPKARAVNKRSPTLDSEVSGFFPQVPHQAERDLTPEEQAAYENLVRRIGRWGDAQALGAYPQAVDVLCTALERSNEDLTIFICKALAQIGDRKAVPALVAKWRAWQAGKGHARSPGARYIPDALAAIGDQAVVPDLLKPLKTVRCDFRFHIVHALGILGGSKAKETLEYVAEHDPHRAVRELAKAFLSKGIPPDTPAAVGADRQ